MEANNTSTPEGEKICLLCKQLFTPHPNTRTRQQVCERQACQLLRQKFNQVAWLEAHPVDYKTWYQDYGKDWRQKNPDYQKQHRQRKRQAQPHPPRQTTATQQFFRALLQVYQAEKKEQLTNTKTAAISHPAREKKEQLSYEFYLLKAKDLALVPLIGEKKEQLAGSFS